VLVTKNHKKMRTKINQFYGWPCSLIKVSSMHGLHIWDTWCKWITRNIPSSCLHFIVPEGLKSLLLEQNIL